MQTESPKLNIKRTNVTEYSMKLSKVDILSIIRSHVANAAGVYLDDNAVSVTVATMGGDLSEVTCTLTIDHSKQPTASGYNGEERRIFQTQFHQHRRYNDAKITAAHLINFDRKPN